MALIMLFVFAILILGIIMLSRLIFSIGLRFRENQGIGRSAGSFPRTTDDGFWFGTQNYPAGATVHYRCRINDRIETRTFIVEPGMPEQFVYTGCTPMEFEVVQVFKPGQSPNFSPPEVVDYSSSSAPDPEPRATSGISETFSGFPSAY